MANQCVHTPFDKHSTLIVESHWSAGSRVRCSVCGGCAAIDALGCFLAETCECHRAAPEPRTYAEVMRDAERDGVNTEELIASLLKKVADQRRELKRLHTRKADEPSAITTPPLPETGLLEAVILNGRRFNIFDGKFVVADDLSEVPLLASALNRIETIIHETQNERVRRYNDAVDRAAEETSDG